MEWRRVNIADQPEYGNFFPVQAFFNEILEGSFIETVDWLTQGIGCNTENASCTFPQDDMDDYERYVERAGKPLEGIEFGIFHEDVVIDVLTFRHFLTMACDAHVKRHPEDRAKIEELLARPQPPLFQESSSPAA